MTRDTADWAGRLVRRLHIVSESPSGRPSDGHLVGRFVADRDGGAFAELVRRHGPMVLGVCRRVLGRREDAEDAFQAVFLVLARRAATVRPPDAVGNWLYGVAYRTALGARRREARQRVKEREAATVPRDPPAPDDPWADLRPMFDAALAALPDKYRQPVVLCDLGGRPRSEVALRLGLAEGTVSSRLARGREMLRDRLARRGLPPTALAAVLSSGTVHSGVPAGLNAATVGVCLGIAKAAPAVLSLTRGAPLAMTPINGTWAAVAAAVLVAGSAIGIEVDGPANLTGPALSVDTVRSSAGGGVPTAAEITATRPVEEPETPEPSGAGGAIVAVDPSGRTVTVAYKTVGGPVREVVHLNADTQVIVDGRPADLPDAPTGAIAAFTLRPRDGGRPRVVAEMRVTGPTAHGRVVAIDDETITLDPGGKVVKPPPRKYRLALTATAHTAKNGRVIPLDVRVGETATVTLTADQSTAVAVSISRDVPIGKGKPRPADRD